MSAFFGPLDSQRRVPPRQQTRVAAFLISAHGALARQFAFVLPLQLESAWQTELNAQLYRESEIVSLMARATAWVPDLALGYAAACWERAWLPTPIEGVADRSLSLAAGLATLAHAVHAGVRPAALLPAEVDENDPFAMALRRVELESGRLLQAQMILLKGQSLMPFRHIVSTALEERHAGVRTLWQEALRGVGIDIARPEK